VAAGLEALQPRFATLLADQSWLPDEFAAPYEASGMGGGIGTWLLFRAADRSLSLFSLVVCPSSFDGSSGRSMLRPYGCWRALYLS
jgi:hypothetical protein